MGVSAGGVQDQGEEPQGQNCALDPYTVPQGEGCLC